MPIKILIAEDHAIVREGLKLILELNENINVIGEADDGLSAVRRTAELNPDIVLMDIAMPNMNGIEACKRIIESSKTTKVLILSMYSSHEDIYRSLKAGAFGYLLKESIGQELIDAVFSVSKGTRYLSKKVDDILIDRYIKESLNEESKSPLEKLSPRETEILQMIAEGKSSNEIAGLLFLSVKTVETYRSRLMLKLGIKHLHGLIKFAIEHGLTK
jgi:DNA-binding NarL/FixJ family response regulator